MSERERRGSARFRPTPVRLLGYLAVVLLAWNALSCQKVEVKKPQGFAETKEPTRYHAISPEGVTFRVRSVNNYPEKKLEFWRDAVKNHLVEEGYQLVGEDDITAGSKPGVVFRWGAPYGRSNYIYLTAIIVFGKEIAVAEASCEVSLFAKYKGSLYASIASIKLN
jgi:hypothetical protein